MIGNLKGWLIAGAIIALQVVLVMYLLGLDKVSAPSALGSDPANLATLTLDPSWATVVPLNRAVDSGSIYRRLAQDAETNRPIYESQVRSPDAAQIATLSALNLLIEARGARPAPVFKNSPELVVAYGSKPSIEALELAGQLGLVAVRELRESNPQRSQQLAEAVFTLGVHLWEERLVYQQADVGIRLLNSAASWISMARKDAGDTASVERIEAFVASTGKLWNDRGVPMYQAIFTVNSDRIRTHAGDIFVFANNAQERMWRVEAVLKLGRMKYNVGTNGHPGDQSGAKRLVRQLAENESDPFVKRAAQLALELTPEQFRMVR